MRPASLLVGVPLIVDFTTLRHDKDGHISRILDAKHFHCMPTSPTSKSAQTGAHESPHAHRILSIQYRILLRTVYHPHMSCTVLYFVLVRRRVVNYPPHSFPYQQQYIPLSDTSSHPKRMCVCVVLSIDRDLQANEAAKPAPCPGTTIS